MSRNVKMSSQFFALLAAALFLVACNGNGNGFPQVASPPPFDYVDGDELRSRMHQLAFELQQLDMVFTSEEDDNSSFQQDIVNNLRNIERIGGVLQTGDLSSKHPFLQDDMDRFLADVRKARSDASRNSPRYYMAGRISGSCVSCHRANQ